MKSMTEKNATIINAAATMFARYGYTKTTMGDIAAEAGVARQTVYNAFPGKEEILRAVVSHAGAETYRAVIAAWAQVQTVAEKLAVFHDLVPLKWFEAIRAAPDWVALMDGLRQAGSAEMTALNQQWRAELTAIFAAHAPLAATAPASHEEIADFFYTASLNAKHGVDDITELRSRLRTIKAATLALLAAHETGSN